jgi:hypothetical protein
VAVEAGANDAYPFAGYPLAQAWVTLFSQALSGPLLTQTVETVPFAATGQKYAVCQSAADQEIDE